ncbi:MAG TPA: hypothetical protein VLF62_01000 [Candidatus Saccharimonadales bacterium]|nr:hypothetical protein [Candidatus Saccharimonadales bacterium]
MAEALIITQPQAVEIFGNTEPAAPGSLPGEALTTRHGVVVEFGATTLGLQPAEEGKFQVTGNTVPRLCEAADGCTATACGLGDLAISNDMRREANCAAANTIPTPEASEAYVMTPLSNNIVFFGDEGVSKPINVQNEQGETETLFQKVATGSVLIISEHDLADKPDGVSVKLNLADSVVGVETHELEGTRYAAVFYSSRENLGDRDGAARLLYNTHNAILDRHGLQGEARQEALRKMNPQIEIGYSASLKNFAHEVRVPEYTVPAGMTSKEVVDIVLAEEGAKVPVADRDKRITGPTRYALQLMRKHEIIDTQTGEVLDSITPTQLMDDQYPGALVSGEIYGQFEGEAGLEESPRGPQGCPGDGERCHINYPKITKRTRVQELLDLGIPEENISYNNSGAIDSASQDNRLASNRRAQLAGVPINKTLRTVNGVTIKFPPRAAAAEDALAPAA